MTAHLRDSQNGLLVLECRICFLLVDNFRMCFSVPLVRRRFFGLCRTDGCGDGGGSGLLRIPRWSISRGDEGEELQPFVWRLTEAEAPSLLTYRIVEVMERYQLLHLDKMRVSVDALLSCSGTDSEQAVDRRSLLRRWGAHSRRGADGGGAAKRLGTRF